MNDKIKMFIADEEVVSNNDFTINEEMLSASSTILNNCYPKSWELTKDYVSNFYYPKDYSRFVLAQGEYEHGNQEFAPLEITGKNIVGFNDKELFTSLGVNIIVKNDEITVNGTTTGAGRITITLLKSELEIINGVDYTLSAVVSGTVNNNFNIQFRDSTNTTNVITKYNNALPFTFNNLSGVSPMLCFYVANNTTFTNYKIKLQLEKGTTATSYEPYNQPNLSYETNVEKEWNTFNIYGNTYQDIRSGINLLKVNIASGTVSHGITATVNADKSITLNGTNDGNTSWLKIADNFTLPAGTYTLSNGNSNAVYSTAIFMDDNHNFSTANTTTATFTSTVTIIPYIRVYSGAVLNNLTIYPMIVKGSYTSEKMPPYEQYGAMPSPEYPSELINTGYQNLLKPNFESSSGGGMTVSITDKGWLANGTPTGNTSFYIFNSTLPAGTYTINGIPGSAYNTYQLVVYKAGTIIKYLTTDNYTFTLTEETAMALRLYFYTNYGRFDNMLFPYQLEKGSSTHSYIPYGKYGVEIRNMGKNILGIPDVNYSGYGLTIKSENGIITINGTATSTITYDFNLILPISSSLGMLTKSLNPSGTYNNIQTSLRNNSGNLIGLWSDNASNVTNIISEDAYKLRIQINSGINVNATLKPQVEEGTIATIYEVFKSNTQLYVLDEPLRQIGTYKDKLYTDGRVLYVERNIAKKILEGADHNGGGTTGTNAYFLETKVVCLNNNNIIVGMSNMFAPISFTNRANGLDVIYGQNGKVVLRTANNTSINWSNGTNRYNWLETNKPKINYILATPIITPLGYIDLPISYEGINYTTIYTGLDTRTELWYYWKNYNVLFAGVVKNSGDISLNPRHPHYCSLQILDYKTFLSESNTLDFVIANKTIKEAIEMVVNAVKGYGFVVGNIDIDSANDNIGAYSTLNKTAYDVLQYLAEISGSRWRARVIDSLTMAIDFYDPDTLPEADDIEYTKEYWEANNIVDMTFNYGSRDYRNKQILLSNEVYGNINYEETLISNGYGDTFTVQNNIGVLLNVIVDGAEKTIATINDKQMGIDADFYYTPGKNIIESNGVYSAGTMIRATYQPLVKGRQIVYNASEVERISNQTQTEGVIARYESRNDILSSEELQKIAQTYIDYKGKAEVIIKITTEDNDLYDIGEVVYFNAPIDDLKQNYMVKAKDIEYIIIDKIIHLFYVYELTSSFNSEKAINYFDNQRNKASGNIQEGDSITRNIDIETQVGIIWTDGAVSSTTITVDGDNVLNSILNSPFVE